MESDCYVYITSSWVFDASIPSGIVPKNVKSICISDGFSFFLCYSNIVTYLKNMQNALQFRVILCCSCLTSIMSRMFTQGRSVDFQNVCILNLEWALPHIILCSQRWRIKESVERIFIGANLSPLSNHTCKHLSHICRWFLNFNLFPHRNWGWLSSHLARWSF